MGPTAVAHDLRTTLSSVAKAADALLDPRTSAERGQELLDSVRREILWMSALIEIASLDGPGHEPELDRRPLDLTVLAGDVVALLEPSIKSRRQTVRLEIDPRLETVVANVSHVMRIMLNLIDGASSRAREGDVVRVVLRQRRSGVLIAACGRGVAVRQGARQPGLRALHWDGPRGGSDSIGLALVQALVRDHGGAVGVSRGRTGQSCVWCYLPQGPEAPRQ